MPAVEGAPSDVTQLLHSQMQLLQQQAALLAKLTGTPAPAIAPPSPIVADDAQPADLRERPFGAAARITTRPGFAETPQQKAWLDNFTRSYNERTAKSKAFSQQHRMLMADPRVVTGFNPLWKELVYPIVVERSKGARMWDIDGHEYIDLLNGFGANFFGYQPDFIADALVEQINAGMEIGPQHPLTADVAQLISDMTGMPRVAFCNTGSEAVMGAMRIARTVTGRKTIVIFKDSYHGIFDEVIVRGTKQLRSIAAAPGILANAVENVMVLDYGSPESLRAIRERARRHRRGDDRTGAGQESVAAAARVRARIAHDLRQRRLRADLRRSDHRIPHRAGRRAGVLRHQGRHRDVRQDHRRRFAVRGDRRTCRAGWMRSTAATGNTATTVIRKPASPISPARSCAIRWRSRRRRRRCCTSRTPGRNCSAPSTRARRRWSSGSMRSSRRHNAPLRAVTFASLWRIWVDADQPMAEIFYYALRARGLHVYAQFNCFLTTAHGDAEAATIAERIEDAVTELLGAGILTPRAPDALPKPDESILGSSADEVRITDAQLEKWLACQFGDAANTAFNESLLLKLDGALDKATLQRAVEQVTSRHEAFAMSFDVGRNGDARGTRRAASCRSSSAKFRIAARSALRRFDAASVRSYPRAAGAYRADRTGAAAACAVRRRASSDFRRLVGRRFPRRTRADLSRAARRPRARSAARRNRCARMR